MENPNYFFVFSAMKANIGSYIVEIEMLTDQQ